MDARPRKNTIVDLRLGRSRGIAGVVPGGGEPPGGVDLGESVAHRRQGGVVGTRVEVADDDGGPGLPARPVREVADLPGRDTRQPEVGVVQRQRSPVRLAQGQPLVATLLVAMIGRVQGRRRGRHREQGEDGQAVLHDGAVVARVAQLGVHRVGVLGRGRPDRSRHGDVGQPVVPAQQVGQGERLAGADLLEPDDGRAPRGDRPGPLGRIVLRGQHVPRHDAHAGRRQVRRRDRRRRDRRRRGAAQPPRTARTTATTTAATPGTRPPRPTGTA